MDSGSPRDHFTFFRPLPVEAATATVWRSFPRIRLTVIPHSHDLPWQGRLRVGLFSRSQHSCGVLPLAIHPPAVSLRLCPERSKLPTGAQPQLVSASPRRRHSLFRPFAELHT